MKRRKPALIAASVLFNLVLLEAGARWLEHGHYIKPAVREIPAPAASRFEIPASLSRFPELRPLVIPPGGLEVVEKSRFVFEDGLWLPPRSQRAEVEMFDRATQEVRRRVQVTTDAHGRRIPPWQSERMKTARRHLVFFGCSITWGYGVNDDQTYAALVSKDDPNLVSHNISAGGYGLGEVLLRAQRGESLEDLGPKEGIGVYAMFPGHLQRFFNSAYVVASWREGGVTMKEGPEGKFTAHGPARTAEPVWYWFSRLWNASSLTHLLNLDLPVITQARTRQFVRAIKALRDEYRQHTSPSNPFVVVILPYGFDERALRAALDHEQILFIDYSRYPLSTRLRGPETLPGENHPTPEAHQMLAAVIERDLDNYFNRAEKSN